MKNQFTASASIRIRASAAKVWQGLTDPNLIKKYFFGTEAISDWKVGSRLLFKGVWEGKEYLDKGTILQVEPERLFRYNYLSSFSNLEDLPENYANITYELSQQNDETSLVITQDNILSDEARKHSEQNWDFVLNELKKLLEGT
ncbi:hypothetical protein LEP1GSC047_2163 [Leptospira inadai serovar Lyme str. 10]|uniref:Activator of Hsp90 ATPase homologue 1/2-like C-terminal domain-containing protein n=2 Tax=Leptospira inadai serovar Lyme TaxID=293084 RepID=V6HZG4_9LEPT|nr:SRPBCC family protein [Leptospira inadai]EQA38399.1 hypothetical protein LEP1GSC047_2163 [Leptospira inadai serovar Lyme str. 10]PNV74229.1 ATPase [Leptospira inadai serovar Lyme]